MKERTGEAEVMNTDILNDRKLKGLRKAVALEVICAGLEMHLIMKES